MANFIQFIISKHKEILHLLLQHITLTSFSIFLSILIGVPLGILIGKIKPLRKPILAFINLIQAIPSMALLGLLIPFIGIGSIPAIMMVVIYSLLPIVKNTYTGLNNIDANILEAAEAMGLTPLQTLKIIQMPLALPMIMAGIRISAVTSVGLMTLAAFIGAGGLGYLIFSGIQTVNNNMILAGAIPAAILALIVDYIFGKIEVFVSPKGCSSIPNKKKSIVFNILLLVLAGIIIFSVANNFSKGHKKNIVVGSLNFSEQLILGNMISDLIEDHTDLNVDRKLNLSGSSIAFSAINTGEIDMYVEYTGDLLINVLKDPIIHDPKKAYEHIKPEMENKYNLTLLEPLGFNNTYTIATRKDIAEKYNLNTISDLAKISNKLVFSPTMIFVNRPDGLVGLSKVYNLKFQDVKPMDGSLRYSALNNDNSQAIDAFSTEGLLKAFNLKVLKDDKQFFPPYNAFPLIRKETLEKYPELKDTLNLLTNKLNNETMIELNYKVDQLGESPEKVAKDYLMSQKLISSN
ncbi:glycine betaine ABC transporter substrate-binding protein [Clostridium tarantellae]|uniref:ABC transporter permease subunit n=1 Tax=Clostridium tarantellae TaxID=39493 RepID=A0A6I1ML55_9CLOT|nr:glycine betaine ABC transporter substrate-binding protein [Clostridium tarantellae]MPQ44135.1 ABC transporter permease subunit [Clostridium tarantellae]